MERGLFDAMFIADELAPYNTHEDSSDAVVQWAVQCPTHEPSTIVPIITTATEHLGVGVTLSTAFEHPYSMCRRLSSLDHLSNGRVAWNIVSSYSKSEWDAYGHSMTDRSGRYERLDEYMDVCYQLWDSWEPDAIIADKVSGIYADPAKVKVVHHEGKYYKCHGRHFCAPSPQGRPVLWQAGSSNQGRDFAAKHAEAIFAVHPNVDRMKQYADDLNTRHGDQVQSRAGLGQADLRSADSRRRDAFGGAREIRAHQGLHSAGGSARLDIGSFRPRLLQILARRARAEHRGAGHSGPVRTRSSTPRAARR